MAVVGPNRRHRPRRRCRPRIIKRTSHRTAGNSLTFGGVISSWRTVTLPMQSTAAPGDAGAGAGHGDADYREAGQRFPTRCRPLVLGRALCDTVAMLKHPKQTAEPSTASNRLTPQEIDDLRESVRRRGAEMRAWLAARKKQAGPVSGE